MVSWPSTKARLRPCAVTSRRTIDLAAVGGFEDGLDGGEVFAGADQVVRSAAAEQQAHGADQHRLAGAGLSCQDVERLFKLD